MKLHNERLRMFLEQCSFFSGNLLLLLLKESCGLVQPAGRDDATVCVTNVNLVVTELRDCKEMHVEMSDCLTCDVSDESLSLSLQVSEDGDQCGLFLI